MKLKDLTVLAIGMMSLVIGIFIGRFPYVEYFSFSISNFVEGMLIGLSVVMNLFYLGRLSKKQRTRS
jgi:hypothetical protein